MSILLIINNLKENQRHINITALEKVWQGNNNKSNTLIQL